jgi:acetyl-CoA carboxylase carboxyl transferase beta subunit
MNNNPFKSKKYAVSKVYRARPQELNGQETEKPAVPQGIMTKCPKCGKIIYTKLLLKNLKTCECGYYFKVSAYERIAMIIDNNDFTEFDLQLSTRDPLDFPGYGDKLVRTQTQTGLVDGLVTGFGRIEGEPAMVGVMDASFFMGSMGTAIGEKLARLFERAAGEHLPVIIFTASGGARMQEGIFSLMQMAKVSAAVARHDREGLLYITVLTDPTTGGVTASFAMLGDIILAEPGALIGFAGPRVIEQTIGQKLPEGFQRAEFLLEHGFVDRIVERHELKSTLGALLKLHKPYILNKTEVMELTRNFYDIDDLKIPPINSKLNVQD